jgi:hypothetical protein
MPATYLADLCYPSSWCNLHRRLTAESGSLHKPEVTPPSISTTFATGPGNVSQILSLHIDGHCTAIIAKIVE